MGFTSSHIPTYTSEAGYAAHGPPNRFLDIQHLSEPMRFVLNFTGRVKCANTRTTKALASRINVVCGLMLKFKHFIVVECRHIGY